jgi:hypothetical protein
VSDIAPLLTAIAAIIAAVAGLITALTALRHGTPPHLPDEPSGNAILPPVPDKPVSRRTTRSLAYGLAAAIMALVLVLLIHFGISGQHTTLSLLLLTLVGILTLIGAPAGVERAWTARSTDHPLALTAAVGPVVGLASWVSALIVTAPLW